MKTVNMLDAKTHLSRLVKEVEEGEVPEVAIARNGKVVARLVPAEPKPTGRRQLGLLRGKVYVPTLEEFNEHDAEIAALFLGQPLE
ncbi:Prevent host death protein [uncultured Pleomorphomonas sp.]|uniref:Antitoxin n=2 Tax=Pleomorphomonas TaxID=261933 RepID=A0A2G9WVP6_9HYPH|nr:type II toxin-antitoxin system prevent-host-death family antitoxin [Pleomorphomonas carboxyditropha]PIO98777.1 hypothetical protein CJ014_13830 [Pleomorphomonas carboxyditropha]SCM75658.1 Prevent host death protein [uncultured Pleomorphomonas sp.]